VYAYEILPDVRDHVDGLPRAALVSYAELIAFVELTPWDGAPYRDDKPDGTMRKVVFGPAGEGIVVYLVLEDQRRVVVVSVTWTG
jgi:hypothetical protein